MTAPLIVGLAGLELLEPEREFLAAVRPLGIIVFRRNIADAEQLTALVGNALAASGAALAFVDQEGGRVQRVRPPLAPRYPAAAAIGALYANDPAAARRAAFLGGYLIARDLAPFGLNVPCLPVADVPVRGAHDVIGDRAYGLAPQVVAELAGAAADGVLAAGALPVMKHLPGHGRAHVDSHLSLPDVDTPRDALTADFTPFHALNTLPMGMTAHVRYAAIDPDAPATLSSAAISLIRDEIGFGGLLMTDDISMGALGPDVAANAARALRAGCDCVLHCNGDLDEMRAIAAALPPITPAAGARLAAALAARRTPAAADIAVLRAEFDTLLGAGA
ncbi:MAG: beta-N-acetylhexosaminidase [Acuticoccus sp.]